MTRQRKFKPKNIRASVEERTSRAEEEERRRIRVRDAAAAEAASIALRNELEMQGENEKSSSTSRGPGSGIFGGGPAGESGGRIGGASGSLGGQMLTGLVYRPKPTPSQLELEAKRAHKKARRKAYELRRKQRIARRIAAAPLLGSFRNLRIVERVAAGGNPEDEGEENAADMEELYTRLFGEDEEDKIDEDEDEDNDDDDDDDIWEGAGSLGGSFGGRIFWRWRPRSKPTPSLRKLNCGLSRCIASSTMVNR